MDNSGLLFSCLKHSQTFSQQTQIISSMPMYKLRTSILFSSSPQKNILRNRKLHSILQKEWRVLSRDMQKALDDVPEGMEKMLEKPRRRYIKNARAMLRTPADIFEHPSHFSFHLDMPGLEVSNIKAKVADGVLHVSGKKKKKPPAVGGGNETVKPIRIERRRLRYMRKFSLPQNSNPEDVKATYKDGVLTITVAKKLPDDSSKPRTVAVPISWNNKKQ